jgi:alpha-tubulin suppressor-like RCC1 family protein
MNNRRIRSRFLDWVLPALLLAALGAAGAAWGATPQVAAGGSHTLTLRSDGTLWASGANGSGQLGDGSGLESADPVQVGNGNWTKIAAGLAHSLGIQADGSLWAWGDNTFGQIGDGTGTASPIPVRVGTANDWVAVAAGGSSSFALKGDGSLWGWGDNGFGQLGNADPSAAPANLLSPVQVVNPGTGKYVAVSGGGTHTLALQADGTLWSWGSNEFGQLGNGTSTPGAANSTPIQVGVDADWRAISAGGAHSVVLKADGTLWSWGANDYGQLGNGVAVPGAIVTDPAQVGTDTDWGAVSAGDLYTLALKRNGSVWGWGSGTSGELGNGVAANTSDPTPIGSPSGFDNIVAVAAGGGHSHALRANGALYAWGINFSGEFGNGTANPAGAPAVVGFDTVSWIATEPGNQFTVALRSNGTLWGWGENSSGQLGDATFASRNTPAEVAGGAATWTASASGLAHTVALRGDGTLWGWGENGSGQVGDGTNSSNSIPQQIFVTQPSSQIDNWRAVAAGDFHNVAIKSDGTLWAWGDDSFGQLGDGNLSSHKEPIQILTKNPGNFDSNWVAVAAGGSFSLGLQADGTLWAWGDNSFLQLGADPALLAPATFSSVPVQLINFAPPAAGFNSGWVAVAAGLGHAMALQADGTLWSWGDNSVGQLGDGTTTSTFTPVQVINAGSVPYAAMSAGDSHSLARRADGTLWAWGNDTAGQLGTGPHPADTDPLNPQPHPTPVQVAAAADWTVPAVGGSHSVALKADGTIWSWGSNASGQLGDGTFTDAALPASGLVFTVTASAGANGSITPSGTILVASGAGKAFTITANPSFHIADVVVDGASVGAVTTYTFTGVTENHTIAASFAVDAVTITASAGANGSITPSGAVQVTIGTDRSFTITPAAGFHIADVLVDGSSVGAVTTFTFSNVTANHTIAASFAIDVFTITATAGANGSITPSGAIQVNSGANRSFTITPAAGFHVADVLVDGTSVGAVTTFTFSNVTANHTIAASFAIDVFTITATAGANGSITSSGPVQVNSGANQGFTITPAAGFHVANVLVDGTSVGAVTTFTFSNVTANHTIVASFAIDTFTITAGAGANGSITPSGAVQVNSGASQGFTIAASPRYHIVDVVVDGVSVGAVTTFTFSNVTANHTIAASFAIDVFTITATAGANGSINPAGAVPVDSGTNQAFTITPAPGYHIAGVTIDGTAQTIASGYTFNAVSAGHAIAATFALTMGDANQDGVVDIADAVLALRAAVNLVTPTQAQIAAIDAAPLVNGLPTRDGTISVGDALLVLRKVIGVIDY